MQETITLTLSSELKLALDDVTRQEEVSLSELINAAIRDYLFLRQFRLLREHLIPQAQTQGIFTDQDVFDRVS